MTTVLKTNRLILRYYVVEVLDSLWARTRAMPMEQASVERDLEVIHSKLTESDFARLSTAGQSMTVDEAAALALEE